MNIARNTIVAAVAASALILAPVAQARTTDRTKATIVGAAVGGVLGSAAGNNMESTLLGAAIGGTAGNLYAKRNQKREAAELEKQRREVVYRDRHHHHYYYGDDDGHKRKKYRHHAGYKKHGKKHKHKRYGYDDD